jgi:bifunctional non-homologous end joining protein LigD
VPKVPTVTVANHPDKAEALAGLARWKERHPSVAARLAEADILVDSMRGRSTTWTRIRVRLGAVPVDERPAQETPDPDVDPTRADRARWAAMRKGGRPGDGS